MSKPHRLNPDSHQGSAAVARRGRVPSVSPQSSIRPIDPQALAIAEDLNNPLAVVLTNLDLLGGLLARIRDDLVRHRTDEIRSAMRAHLDEAQSCLNDARQAAKRLQARVKRSSVPPPPTIQAHKTAVVKKGAVRPARILIVDDDADLARALGRLFRDYDVVVHCSPVAALGRVVTGERFDIIVSDVTMPGMSGPDLHSEIQHFAPEQASRMVFLTGGGMDPSAEGSLTATGQPVFAKPFDTRELRAFVEKFLG
jgi:CheY-like chemotaxis protein